MSKNVWILAVLVAMVLALGSGASFALPSLGGGTGVVSVPDALVAPVGELQAVVGYQKVTETFSVPSVITGPVIASTAAKQLANRKLAAAQVVYFPSEVSEDFNVWSLQACAGVADGAELWAAYQHASSDLIDNIWGIGGKYQFLREPKDQLYVAGFASYDWVNGESIGLYDGSSFDAGGHVWKIGVAATKDLTPASVSGSQWASGGRLFGTVGVVYFNSSSDLLDDNMFEPYVAAEFVTTGGTTLGLEYRFEGSMDQAAVWSAVLKQRFAQGWGAEIGITNADPLGFGTDDQNFFVRVGYAFPMSMGK